jgi:heptose-I-phosphate ethanolaminephosphotransferase
MVILQYLLQRFTPNRFSALSISAIQMLLLLVPIIQWAYFFVFGSALDEIGVMAAYQTNINEGLEFLASLGAFALIAFALFLLAFFIVLYKLNIKTPFVAKNTKADRYTPALLLVMLVPVTFYIVTKAFVSTVPIEMFLDVRDYFKQAALYKTNYAPKYDNLIVSTSKDKPKTVILVIGESETRTEMSVYNNLKQIENTPWLSSNKNNSNVIIFSNIYACATQTVPVLEKALTEANFYNHIKFNEAVSIIDIAKKSGYKTYWFSNQGTIGAADSSVTLIAETANVSKWTKQEISKQQYDEALLKYFDDVDASKDNFIVFHIMGSHDDYHNRYPKQFQKWSDKGEMDSQADYDNTVLYTDYILSTIYEYAKTNLNLDVMIYFSDHGVDPTRRRQPDETGFKSVRIPFFIYLSDSYKERHDEVYDTLRTNENIYATNDLAYNLMCELLGAESNHCDTTYSIASKEFKLQREDLLTRRGGKFIKDDVTY